MSLKETPMGLFSTSQPRQRPSGGLLASANPGYSVVREDNLQVKYEIYERMRALAQVEVEFVGVDGAGRSKIRLYHNGPLSWYAVKDLSRRLTAEFDFPILVLPKTSFGDEICEEPMTGEYRQFEAHVVLVRTESDKSALFEIATCHERSRKDKETGKYLHDSYALAFPGETVLKCWYKPELSFPIARHVYTMQHRTINFIAYSDEALELGQVYRVGGLMFHAQDRKNTKATPFQDAYMLIDWAIPVRNTVDIDQAFFDRFRGLSHEEIRDAIAFPFENSISDYKELLFISTFYIRSGTIPFNVFLLGKPGCTKSAFLKRLAAISGDYFVDGGAATLKGIVPSFSPKAPRVGVLGSARYFVLINEFLHIVKGGDKAEAPYNVLSVLKNLLEGERTHIPSGIGSMDIKMRASTFIASNWIDLGRGGRLSSVNDFYGRFDPALLDRFFLFPVRQKTQMRMVDQHSEEVKDRIKVFEKETGIRDEVEILERMPTPYRLNTYDFRTLLLFKEQLVARLDIGARQAINDAVAAIHAKWSYERFTRVRDAITNIASAKAFERELAGGRVTPETAEIAIGTKEIREAAEYVELVLGFYGGMEESESVIRKEFYRNSASKGQRYIIDVLKDRYLSGTDLGSCSLLFDTICDSFKAKYPEMDWNVAIRPLIQGRVVAYDGMRLIWLPDGMEDELVRSLFVGDGNRDFMSTESLNGLHLLDGSLHAGWLSTLPLQPVEAVQKLVRELCAQTPVNIGDLKTRAGLNAEVVENAAVYLHLCGDLWNTKDGYLAKPRKEKPA